MAQAARDAAGRQRARAVAAAALANVTEANEALAEAARMADPGGAAAKLTQEAAKAAWEEMTGVKLDAAGRDQIYSAVAEMAKRRLEEQARQEQATQAARRTGSARRRR